MALESSFLNLIRGNRLTAYMGLEMDPGVEALPMAVGYSCIDIPLREIQKDDGTVVERGLRNQHLRLVPACSLDVRDVSGGYKVLVEPNPALSEFGSVQGMYYIQPGSGRQAPGLWITLRKDLDLSSIPWVVRLYMRI